jgi:myo-inositol-1-phosphate synthase
MSKINVAIVGVGNVTKTLFKGLEFYKNSTEGLWHPKIGGFSLNDISVNAIYDVDSSKVGKKIKDVIPDYQVNSDLSIQAGFADDPINFQNGPIKSVKYNEFVESLKKIRPDFLVNLISSGMDKSSEGYAKAALESGCSFLNAISSKVITPQLQTSFESKGLMILGDDLMSQFGGTAFHRGVMELMVNRGVKIQKAYQLDVGGNTDTQNTMAEELREKKRKIKTESISTEVPYTFRSTAGTTEYAEQLGNSRVSYYWIEAKSFLGVPLEMDLSLRTNDSANGCNVILDCLRAAKYAISKNDFAKSDIISAYGFKNPTKKAKIRESIKKFEESFAN